MMTIGRSLFAIALAASAALAAPAAGQAADRIEKALGLRLEVVGGGSARLADLAGKVVLVKLWASWCPQCRDAFPKLDALGRELRPRGVEIVAVSVDEDRKKLNAYLAGQSSDMLILVDPRARLLQAFGASTIPSSYVLDRTGAVRYRHKGYDEASITTYRREIEALLGETATGD